MKCRTALFLAALSAVVLSLYGQDVPPYAQAELKRLDRELEPLMALHDAASGNLARGKKYTFSDTPNYGHCSGPSDATDLTNGVSESSSSGIWVCGDCVCWSSKESVSVTIDLGETSSYDRVRLFSGSGCAGVHLPSVVLVEASDDNKEFHCIGDLATLSRVALPRQNAGHHVFVFDGTFPAVSSRYVRLRMRPVGQYLPITEIEVMAATDGTAAVKPDTLPASPTTAELGTIGKRAAIAGMMRENMLRQAEDVRYDGAGYDELIGSISHYSFQGDPDNFKAVYPLCNVQCALFARHAAYLRAQGAPAMVLRPVDFYEQLNPVKLPGQPVESPMLRQIMMNGEQRGCALVLCNTTENTTFVQARLEGLEGDLYNTRYLDSEFFFTTSTMLEPHETLEAIPGLVCEIALVLRAEGLAEGVHSGRLVLSSDGAEQVIPVELEILPGQMPAKPALMAFGWDYLDLMDGVKTSWLGMPAERFEQFQKMRLEDLCMGTAGSEAGVLCPSAIKVDEKGNLIGELDFKNFDKWVEQYHPGTEFFMPVAIGLNWDNAKFGDKKLEPGTKAFNKAITTWAKLINEHIVAKGLKGRIAFQLFDEPGLDPKRDMVALFKLMQQWHTPFHKGAPDIPLFIDPCNIYNPDCGKYLTNGEIFCPEVELLHGEGAEQRLAAIAKLRKEGHPMAVYCCSFGPFLGEPGAFRNQAWMAFRIGARLMGFWGGTELNINECYNRYICQKQQYSPYLLDADGLHRTKHAFANRDGVQDYEYLLLCDSLLTAAEAKKLPEAKELRRLFNEEVLATAGRHEQFSLAGTNMAVRAEEARLRIIDIIRKLK